MLLDKKNIKIDGTDIYLRNVQLNDVSGNWWRWFNDKQVTRFMQKGMKKNTVEDQHSFFKKVYKSENDLVLAICYKENKKHIGTTGLHQIDWEERSAQFGIIIGEKLYWGRSIGSDAWEKVIDYGFTKIKLKKFTQNI